MTPNIVILCAAGMLVTAYLMVGQKVALHHDPVVWRPVAPAGHCGRVDGDQ